MHHTDYLTTAARTLQNRSADYGQPEPCFVRIAEIASLLLAKPVTPYDVARIHIATKLARSVESATKDDTWIDLINYAAFAGQFAKTHEAQPARIDERAFAAELDDAARKLSQAAE